MQAREVDPADWSARFPRQWARQVETRGKEGKSKGKETRWREEKVKAKVTRSTVNAVPKRSIL
jgi:hypothetical protein